MPAIRDWSYNYGTNTGATTIDVPMPACVSGDLLVAVLSTDTTSQTWTCAGWSQVFSVTNTPNLGVMVRAAGASEPASYTFSYTGAETANGVIISIRDADVSNMPTSCYADYDTANRTSATQAMPTSVSTIDYSLILYMSTHGSTAVIPAMIEGPVTQLVSKDGSAHSDSISWTILGAHGNTPSVTSSVTTTTYNGTLATMVINPPAGGATIIPAYCAADPSLYIDPIHGVTAFRGNTAYAGTSTTYFGTTVKSLSHAVGTVAAKTDYGINSYRSCGSSTGPTTANTWQGSDTVLLDANRPNIGTKNILVHLMPLIPADIQTVYDVGLAKGCAIGLWSADASPNIAKSYSAVTATYTDETTDIGNSTANDVAVPPIRGVFPALCCCSYNGSTYTDETTDINSATANDVLLPPQANRTGDMIYFGNDNKFNTVMLTVGTAGVYTGTMVWEYYNGSGWSTLSGVSEDFKSATTRYIAFTQPGDWATYSVNSKTAYWIRARISAISAYTTAPLGTQGWLFAIGDCLYIGAATAQGGFKVTVGTAGSYTAGTLVWEYWNGAWTTFTPKVDPSAYLKTAVTASFIMFDPPSDWATTTVDGSSKYWFRLRMSAVPTAFTTAPLVTQGWIPNFKIWNVHGANTPWGINRVPCIVNSGNTSALLDNEGTLDTTLIKGIGFFTCGFLASSDWVYSMWWALDTTVVAGGVAAEPIDIGGIVRAVSDGHERMSAIRQANNQMLCLQPIQIGDGGTNAVYLDLNTTAIEFPRLYDTASKQVYYCSTENIAGITYYPAATDYIWHRNSIISSPSKYHWKIHSSASASAHYDFSGLTVINAGTIQLIADVPIHGVTFQGCTEIDGASASIENCVIKESTSTAALDVDSPTEMAKIKNTQINSNTNGIKITAAGTYTLDNVTFSGNTYDIENSSASGAVIINCTNGSNPTTYTNTNGGTTTINLTVDVTINVKDTDGDAIENARVFLLAADGGDYPYQETVTISRSGSTATVAHTGHGLQTGEMIDIEGANQEEYNGIHTITYIGVDSYSYTVTGTPDSPATGTIVGTFVIMHELTTALGVATQSMRYLTKDQPFTGWARKSSSAPYYKQGIVSGTVTDTALTTTVFLVDDQ